MSFGSRSFGGVPFGGSGGASFPFVQRTYERSREYDKRDRGWIQGHVSQLLDDRPFLSSTLDRLRDRPVVSRSWEWGVQEQEELTPPFLGFTLDRLRDEPQYIYGYGKFVWPALLPTITSTLFLQLPINAILHGQQQYKTRIQADDIEPARIKHKTTLSASQTGRLAGESPSFTSRTGNKGYD